MPSVVEYFSDHSGYKCGYCKSPNTNYSRGMWAHTMTVSDYQALIDRGWRRSGLFCYKPTMDRTCCPMYTIRCRVLEFKGSKSQKKILKKFNRHLMGQEDCNKSGDGVRRMSTSSIGSGMEDGHQGDGQEVFVESNMEHQNIDISSVVTSEVKDVAKEKQESSLTPADKPSVPVAESISAQNKEVKKDVGPDPNRPPCQKAKLIRHQRKLEKLKEKGVDIANLPNTNKNMEKQLEDFINELPDEFKQKLEVKLVRTAPASPEWMATSKETYQVYVKYQTIIHNDRPEKLTENKFKEFLVHSPLAEEHKETGPSCGYGSFHHQYWLDGKLIGVGVIDILPKCVSSVYFFYDPTYVNLSLGTYGALREIAFTRDLHKTCPELQYYYMGFYIHSCRKMRYKGNFFPSDLLCPETYKWFQLNDCIPKLEAAPYSRLNPDIDAIDEDSPNEADLHYIPILKAGSGGIMHFKDYRRKYSKKVDDKAKVMEYAELVGKKMALSLILAR